MILQILFTCPCNICYATDMIVKFLNDLLEKQGIAYNELASKLGISRQRMYRMLGKDPKRKDLPPQGMSLEVLCKVRRLSKKNWAQFGRMLDDEFLGKEED